MIICHLQESFKTRCGMADSLTIAVLFATCFSVSPVWASSSSTDASGERTSRISDEAVTELDLDAELVAG